MRNHAVPPTRQRNQWHQISKKKACPAKGPDEWSRERDEEWRETQGEKDDHRASLWIFKNCDRVAGLSGVAQDLFRVRFAEMVEGIENRSKTSQRDRKSVV